METDPPKEKENSISQNGKFINDTSDYRIPEVGRHNVKTVEKNKEILFKINFIIPYP